MQSVTAKRIEKRYELSSKPYVEVHYTMIFSRKPHYYIFSLVIPSFVITTLSLIGLFAPFNANGERQEKISMGLTTLLAMSVLLLMISDQMPKTSEGLPLLGLYIMFEMGISAMASVVSMFVMYMHKYGIRGRPVPGWLWLLLCLDSRSHWLENGTMFEKVNPRRKKNQSLLFDSSTNGALLSSTTTSVLINSTREQIREDWSRVSARVDVVLMVLFLAGNILLSILTLVVYGMWALPVSKEF